MIDKIISLRKDVLAELNSQDGEKYFVPAYRELLQALNMCLFVDFCKNHLENE